MESELDGFWAKAEKFPSAEVTEDRIDVDSFVQIYRDIDDLFELEDDEEGDSDKGSIEASTTEGDDTDDDEQALEQVFETMCDKDKLIAKDIVRQWDEIVRLIQDGLLGEDEFDRLWAQTPKSPGTSSLDVDGFLSFNVFLDDLFVFDDEEEGAEDSVTDAEKQASALQSEEAPTSSMVTGDDLPPGVLFAALANEDYLVGREELNYWGELQDMLKDGDILPEELEKLFTKNLPDGNDLLTEDAFLAFYNAVDDLFEDEETEVSREEDTVVAGSSEAKGALLDLLGQINENEERLPCGLEAEEREESLVQNIVSALEKEPSNFIQKTQGDIVPDDLAGDWKLLYSSSSAMRFNKGLSGLGGSFPNGKFGGLKQTLKFSKFMQDVEYAEQIDVTPDTASFEVFVNGAWELRKSISLFTNQPCTMLYVEPDRVKYGPTSTRADHWKSLGPLNMLDVTYLDDDLRVMRGNTATDAIFVFQRI